MMPDLSMSYEKMSDFVSSPLCGFVVVKKMRNWDFESHWKPKIVLRKKDMMPDLNIPHGKMSEFGLVSLFGFTLVIKLRNFAFESHWNTLICFDKKRYGVRFEYVP